MAVLSDIIMEEAGIDSLDEIFTEQYWLDLRSKIMPNERIGKGFA